MRSFTYYHHKKVDQHLPHSLPKPIFRNDLEGHAPIKKKITANSLFSCLINTCLRPFCPSRGTTPGVVVKRAREFTEKKKFLFVFDADAHHRYIGRL